jgi:DivIVA protein
MSLSKLPMDETKYYDPTEVEAYIEEATITIKNLQARLSESTRRAEEAERSAERSIDEGQPEPASLGRALLLASQVAERTIYDADIKAAEIIDAAKEAATVIIAAAQQDADRLVEAAEKAGAVYFRNAQDRLLVAVSAFVEGADILQRQLAELQEEASGWQDSTSTSAVTPADPPPPAADRGRSVDLPGGIHNHAGRNGSRRQMPDADRGPGSSAEAPSSTAQQSIPSNRDRDEPDAR